MIELKLFSQIMVYMPRACIIWFQWQLSDSIVKEMRSPNKRANKPKTKRKSPTQCAVYLCLCFCIVATQNISKNWFEFNRFIIVTYTHL